MIYFHVLVTIRAVRFETFVIFHVTHVSHGAISHLFADGLALQFVLCFSKHARLLKFLMQDSHRTLSSEYVHGGIDLQSLHVSPHLCVTRSTSFITASAHIVASSHP